MANKLHLGSGGCILSGWNNYDIDTKGGAMPLNLEEGLPFDDGSADRILISHTLCLLKKKEFVVKEMLRVLKKGGLLEIIDNPQRFYTDKEEYRDEHSESRKNLLSWLKGTDAICLGEKETAEYVFSEELERSRNNHKSFYIKATKL
jgi:ubiquinone/menaquinone biosynthesis C-methylase UbiE